MRFLKWIKQTSMEPSSLFQESPALLGEVQFLFLGTRWRPGIHKAEQGGQGPADLDLAGSTPTVTLRDGHCHPDRGQETRGPGGAKDFAQESHMLSSG